MNIILIGFMASGKSTIGKALAQKLNFIHADTDEIIVRQQNMEIKDIFSHGGEAYFRQLESDAIKQLQEVDNHVISVGGGAVMFHDNLNTLKDIGITVFLDAPLQKILSNLRGNFRPLIGNTIDEQNVKELLQRRYPTYKKADITIDTEKLDVLQTVDEIIARLEL